MLDDDTDVRIPPWKCQHCGYLMDAAGCMTGMARQPKPADVCVCLSCAAPYMLDAFGTWQPLTAWQFHAVLTKEERQTLMKTQWAALQLRGTVPRGGGVM